MGYQTTDANVGKYVDDIPWGILAVNIWYRAYLVYLLLLPGLMLAIAYIPGKGVNSLDEALIAGQGENRIAGFAWKFSRGIFSYL